MLSTQQFKATLVKSGTGAYVTIPFDPDEVWGAKEQHYVAGSIAGLEIITKIFWYYFHERVWAAIPWGRRRL